jgi:hypothetical protein
VLFHVPWYNSNKAHQGAGDNMMAAMEPLLYAASVDLVLAGHVHAYERSVRLLWFSLYFKSVSTVYLKFGRKWCFV